MYYEGISNELPVEAIVARNMGDEDWTELCDDHHALAYGCSHKAPLNSERDEGSRFEAEPITIKDLTVTRRRTYR